MFAFLLLLHLARRLGKYMGQLMTAGLDCIDGTRKGGYRYDCVLGGSEEEKGASVVDLR